MNHHEEEGIVDGTNGIEKESWTTTGVVEGRDAEAQGVEVFN